MRWLLMLFLLMPPLALGYECDAFDSSGNELCGQWLADTIAAPPDAVDAQGNRYWAGTEFTPERVPRFNHIPDQKGGEFVGYVVKTDGAGQLVYSTGIGSGQHNSVDGLIIDNEGQAIVGGVTFCQVSHINDVPPCRFFYQGDFYEGFAWFADTGEPSDQIFDYAVPNGYVAKIGPFGQFFVWGWHLSGHGLVYVKEIALNESGQVIAQGITTAYDFPVTRHVATCGNPTGDPAGESTSFTAIIGETGIVEAWCGEDQAAGTLTTVGLYNPNQGRFLLKNEHAGGRADHNFRFGPAPSDRLPVTGDWNNNGQATIGGYDQRRGQFWLGNELRWTNPHIRFRYGPRGVNWTPITGDWNGDGTTTVGLYDPVSSQFFLKNSHTPGAADVRFRFGPAGFGWLPVAGDWDGDGIDTIGLYDPMVGTFYLKNSLAGGGADMAFRFGPTGLGWLPLAGDWDGDGMDTAGLYDPAGSRYHLLNSHAGGTADVSFRYGPFSSGWIPLAGDWDGR